MKTKLIAFLCVLLFVASLHAQTPVQPVTGSSIPDVMAFRIWLGGNEPGGNLRHLGLNLPPADAAVVLNAVRSYQALPETKHGALIDWATHYGTINVLWANVRAQLSSAGWATFDAYLQGEKENMQASPFDFGLGKTAVQNLKEQSMVASHHMMQGPNMHPNYGTYNNQSLAFSDLHNDYFQRPNSGSPGSPWVVLGGSFAISNNTLIWTSGWGYMYYNAAGAATADQDNFISFASPPSNGNATGASVRQSPTTHTNYTVYGWCGIYNGSYQCSEAIYLWLNGTPKLLGSVAIPAFSAGDSIGIVAHGNVLTAYYNFNQMFEAVDSTIGSGYPGIDASAGTPAQVNNFMAGTGLSVYSNVTVSGNTICSGSCPSGVTHTGRVTNTLPNGAGGTIYGTPVPPANSLSVQSIQTEDVFSGTPGIIQMSAGVACSAVGSGFFTASFSKFEWGFEKTKNLAGAVPPPWPQQEWCSNTATPDLSVLLISVPVQGPAKGWPFYNNYAVLKASVQGNVYVWAPFPPGAVVSFGTLAAEPDVCTYNPF